MTFIKCERSTHKTLLVLDSKVMQIAQGTFVLEWQVKTQIQVSDKRS